MSGADLLPVTLRDMRTEIARELSLRRRVYPRLVQERRLSQRQADWRLRVVEEIDRVLAYLEERQGWPTGQSREGGQDGHH